MSPNWESVYRDNVEYIYRLIFSRVGNRPDAEDLTSEVFRTALRPLRLSASDPEIRAYLRATAQTVLASHWRRRFGIEVTTLNPDSELPDAGAVAMESDAPERAAELLDGLPDRYRRILELRFLEALSLKEAARAMNITVGNAKVLQHRALRLAAGATEGREQ
jgi:RNA polymerase sigma-70 factor (ECF subfamily)